MFATEPLLGGKKNYGGKPGMPGMLHGHGWPAGCLACLAPDACFCCIIQKLLVELVIK